MNEQEMMSIYVLPTEPFKPPRALIFKTTEEEPQMGPPVGEFEGAILTWSQDVGTWITEDGVPIPTDFADTITEHAKSLGVEAFLD